jgi:hypothetical protein
MPSSGAPPTVYGAGSPGEEDVPYVRCPVCALDTYSAAGHSTTDECPRCGAPLKGGVHWERVAGPRVRRRRIALAGLDPDVAQDEPDVAQDERDAPPGEGGAAPAITPAAP